FAHGSADRLELVVSSGLLRIDAVALRRLDEAAASAPPAPAITGAAETSVVIIGNCQAELLAQGFREALGLQHLGIKYHFVGLAERFHAAARADLANANVVFVQ